LNLENLEDRKMMAGIIFRLPEKMPPLVVDPPVEVASPAPTGDSSMSAQTAPPSNGESGLSAPQALAGQAAAPPGEVFAVSELNSFATSTNSEAKPQSKVWEQGGNWWAAIADSSGMWVRRLDGETWTKVMKLSTATTEHADVLVAGNVAHVLLFNGANSHLVSLEYDATTRSYTPWSARPEAVSIPLSSGTETATIDIDSTGRMWLISDGKSTVEARYSDGDYSTWSAPIILATGIGKYDLSTVIAMPNNTIGVMWSNQNTERFGFRMHHDSDPPGVWSADELPAAASAQNVGAGFADDHINLAVSSNGTLYAAVKTSYDKNGYPKMLLLVRRPDGSWDPAYAISYTGTRGAVAISEATNRLVYIYTVRTGGGEILYRESPLENIQFGPEHVLISGKHDNPSTAKANFTNELVVLAGGGNSIGSGKLTASGIGEAPQPDPDPQPEPEPVDAVMAQFTGNRDTSLWSDRKKTFRSAKELQASGQPDRSALFGWDVSSIPTGSVVQSAQLTLTVTDSSNDTYNLYQMLRHWEEKYATWKKATKRATWGEQGAAGSTDFDADAVAQIVAGDSGQVTIDLNAEGLAMVQKWIDDPSSNHGIIVQGYGNSSDSLSIASREASASLGRPTLNVTYLPVNGLSQATSLAIAASLDSLTKRK
jgi:hypothetical protein